MALEQESSSLHNYKSRILYLFLQLFNIANPEKMKNFQDCMKKELESKKPQHSRKKNQSVYITGINMINNMSAMSCTSINSHTPQDSSIQTCIDKREIGCQYDIESFDTADEFDSNESILCIRLRQYAETIQHLNSLLQNSPKTFGNQM